MIKIRSRNEMREHRHRRLRKRVSGTPSCPRLAVFRSLRHIYAQLIDDEAGHTLASASTLERALAESIKHGSDQEAAKAVGRLVAERAKAKGIERVVFDRGGHVYLGRVKALAEAAREAGLKF
jgi:large subunit ribosomal protein L18